MAQKGTPVVRAGYLYITGCQPLLVGSVAWFTWLETAHLFSYQASQGDCLTLRKEKRRQGNYWYAYLKRDRKLHNAYAGRSVALTPERLADLLDQLRQKVRGQGR
jgi:LuxR family transcriptional regulator, maltose regulon positive regulatory protein